MSKWFRFYDCVLDDPKAQKLAPPLFKAWVNLLCLASRNDGAIPPLEDVAFALRVDEDKASKWLGALAFAGLIDDDETGMAPHNWAARQFKSDVSTDRVKRFRKQAKAVSETVSETPDETPPEQSRTETEHIASSTVRDALEIECREICGTEPVIVDGNFRPIAELLTEDGITPDDVRAGMRAAMAERGFRPRSWSQLSGWVRRAAKDRLALLEKPQTARAPPAGKPDMYAALEESKRILAARQGTAA